MKKHLNQQGAEFLGTVLQTDLFFDDSAESLRGRGCGLRLRCEKVLRRGANGAPVDSRAIITFKGPVVKNTRVKIREEIETRLDSPKSAAAILSACGMNPTVSIQKRRSSYRIGRARIELDELPLLGKFVEIEGLSERNVETVRKRLNIDGDHIPESYLSMTLVARK